MAAMSKIFRNSAMEFITILLICLAGVNIADPLLLSLLLLASAFLLRAVWMSAILIHGLGHVCMIAILDRDSSFFKTENILEHRTPLSLLKALIPFSVSLLPFIHNRTYPWVAVGIATPLHIRIKALGGILFNAVAVASVPVVISPALKCLLCDGSNTDAFINQFLLPTFAGANLLVLLSSLSDVAAVITGEADCFNCGNFGFLGQRLPEDGVALLPPRAVDAFKIMGQETEIRGAQAGGGAVFVRDHNNQTVFVGQKIINRKRHNLTQDLEIAFAPTRHKAALEGAQSLDCVAGFWHYRYATSSLPTLAETHWHEWMPARLADVWRVEHGQWICDRKTVNHRITHNGDFDAWTLFKKPISNEQLGLWLEQVLHTPNSTRGDSPKIAGMMDLLITQGMWKASLRLAYQLTFAESIEATFKRKHRLKSAFNIALRESEISDLATLIEHVFLEHRGRLLRPDASSMLDLSNKHLKQFQQEALSVFSKNRLVRTWRKTKQSTFVKTVIRAFFHNNLHQATKLLMARAKGSFGLVSASTLNEKSLVLGAWGQPMSTGFNFQDKYMVYASEPAAVDAVLINRPGSYRLDLDQKKGEIAWVGIDDIKIYSMQEDRELPSSALAQRWIPLQNNPYILPPKTTSKDPVGQDIQEIPKVLDSIVADWQNPTSLNCQSANYLAEMLIEKAKSRMQKQRANIPIQSNLSTGESPLDLLIIGVESSLWLGEQFAEDLHTLLPTLSVRACSANQILQRLKYDFKSLHLDNYSIVLAISQSGQTFSTLQATSTFEQLRQQKKVGELFVMTGELCSLMGSAIDQHYHSESKFVRRIFVNHSGRRTAEPITVAIAAAQTTLTELLLYLAKRLRQQFPTCSDPFGMTLTSADLLTLERARDNFLTQSAVSIINRTANGQPTRSLVHQKLIQGGQKWASHVTETPIAWGIHALYILITVELKAPLMRAIFYGLFDLFSWPTSALWLLSLVTLSDVIIYIFGPWFWTVGLRYIQGRPLFARLGKRTVVIGDVYWVNQLLKAYVSKLFSLSYSITALDVHSANPQDHMLHDFGHRIVRGTLVLLGVPDGRRSPMQKDSEMAAIMTGTQARGVRSLQEGAEIVALGHSSTISRQGFSDAIILLSDSNTFDLASERATDQQIALESLRESRFGSFERLLASYVFFWAMAKRVSSFPLLKYQHWKSQNRTRTMTTASPISRGELGLKH
jgi:hypothetical protein